MRKGKEKKKKEDTKILINEFKRSSNPNMINMNIITENFQVPFLLFLGVLLPVSHFLLNSLDNFILTDPYTRNSLVNILNDTVLAQALSSLRGGEGKYIPLTQTTNTLAGPNQGVLCMLAYGGLTTRIEPGTITWVKYKSNLN
ncbi:hypothetical protein H8356DRAFT_1356814 [Neocallimastix lanati (nom. inval.)]|nr:hypothetical protein H8356DRAFT_1356814 [Neocallimastix sp. JGI-2020a]